MAKKKKARAPKKEPKKKADEEELDAEGDDGLDGEEEEGGDAGLDVAGEDEEELDAEDEDQEEEEDAPPPAKKAKDADEGETVQSKARKKEAGRKKEGQPPVLETWYEWKRGNTYNEKKGLKLVEYRRTKNGAMSTYVGWEKKIPKSFLKKIKAEGLLKE